MLLVAFYLDNKFKTEEKGYKIKNRLLIFSVALILGLIPGLNIPVSIMAVIMVIAVQSNKEDSWLNKPIRKKQSKY